MKHVGFRFGVSRFELALGWFHGIGFRPQFGWVAINAAAGCFNSGLVHCYSSTSIKPGLARQRCINAVLSSPLTGMVVGVSRGAHVGEVSASQSVRCRRTIGFIH